jgi:hypothetical protein
MALFFGSPAISMIGPGANLKSVTKLPRRSVVCGYMLTHAP